MEYKAIKCNNCGGAMYSDQKTACYVCSFCGASEPWMEDFYDELPIKFRHKPIEKVGDAIKLGNVEVMSEINSYDERVLSKKYRLNSIADKLALWDPTTTKALAGVFEVIFRCPFCGGEISGESNQNIFECGFCGNKIGNEQALQPGAYQKKFVMGVGAENVPDRAISFGISKEQAKAVARNLVKRFSNDFVNQDIERRIQEDMKAIYIPFSLADLSVKISVDSNLGYFKAYEEIIDWACPDTTLCDIHLLDRLDPWDFGEAAQFDPAFAEGNFLIASVANNASRHEVIRNILSSRLYFDIKDTFELKTVRLLTWGMDFRKHDRGSLLLPIYYLDRKAEDDEKSRQVRIAVNGQTGKAAALFYQHEKEDFRTLEPDRKKRLSSESTVRTPPVPIVRVGSPFLHKVVPIKNALEKKGLLGKLFSKRT